MATDRPALLAIPAAAALLLWPAVWNAYPIVFADTGTYLSQAIHRYAGWDRPVFYSLFMLPLHATVTVQPIVVAQALLAAWVMWLVCRAVLPGFSGYAFAGGVAALSVFTWLPWIVSELMPDLFTPLLVLVLCLLACVPERLSRAEQIGLAALAAFMIASQQSSLPLACVLLVVLATFTARFGAFAAPAGVFPPPADVFPPPAGVFPPPAGVFPPPVGLLATSVSDRLPRGSLHGRRRPLIALAVPLAPGPRPLPRARYWSLIVLPPVLAVLALCTANLAAHGRFSIAPFGNVFLLARVIYDGPGMAVLRRDCPAAHWRLCPFLDSFPLNSDDFLWSADSPLVLAGGPKVVSAEADAIIRAALRADPLGEARAVLSNTLEQMTRFASGDGLNSWPAQVSPWIERDFPERERLAYQTARQQAGFLSVPGLLAMVHIAVALGGVIVCAALLPGALKRHAACAGFLIAVLLAVPVSAAITGSLSAPHDRYQSRIMWLPPFIGAVSLLSLRRFRIGRGRDGK